MGPVGVAGYGDTKGRCSDAAWVCVCLRVTRTRRHGGSKVLPPGGEVWEMEVSELLEASPILILNTGHL